MSVFPDCFTVIRGTSRLVAGAPRLVVGAPRLVAGAPRCSQTYHNHSHGNPVPVIRDPSYSKGQPECPRTVWPCPEIDSSKFTLHILSVTPGGFQWLKYILLIWTHKILPLGIASLVNYNIEIQDGRRYGDGSRVAGGIDIQIVSFDALSLVNAICKPILLPVSYFLISVTTLWDMIFDQCVCKGRTGHANVLDSKSGCSMASKLDIDLPVTVMLETKT